MVSTCSCPVLMAVGRGKGRSSPSPIAVPFPWRLITVLLQFSMSESQSLIEDQIVIDEYETIWVEGFENLPSPKSEQRRKKRKPKGKGGKNKPKLDVLDADNPERGKLVKHDDLNADNPEGNIVKHGDLNAYNPEWCNTVKLDDLDADNPETEKFEVSSIVKHDDLDADNPEKGNIVKVSDLKSRSQQIPDILKPLNDLSERERCRKLLRSFFEVHVTMTVANNFAFSWRRCTLTRLRCSTLCLSVCTWWGEMLVLGSYFAEQMRFAFHDPPTGYG